MTYQFASRTFDADSRYLTLHLTLHLTPSAPSEEPAILVTPVLRGVDAM